ncbi:MAG: ATP-binding protein [Anaerosomatales bacterium]|nr:ATP-binding protein [Anaerosomatales bacterium]
MRSDRVTLSVPAKGEFAKTVRMTVAELASRLGMNYDEVDDVRMAAEEAFVYACNRLREGEVTLRVELEPQGVTLVVGPIPRDAEQESDRSAEQYATFILQSVCDEFVMESVDAGIELRLVKRMTDPGASDRA